MILDEIALRTQKRMEESKLLCSPKKMKSMAEALNNDTGFPFEKALAADGLSFICEIKKASPSKGLLAVDFPYIDIAREYQAAGADAISCLTEPYYFLGQNEHLHEISKAVTIPLLRKDFIVDSYMIYEAKTLGASAVLLICAILAPDMLKEYISTADSLGLSALVEAHTEEEVDQALAAGARIIGVNNRDLKTFQVDMQTSSRLRSRVPKNILFVSESGIQTCEDIRALKENGADAVLIGETLMREKDRKAALAALRGGLQ
ncbi:MAG: indole-3-glycerol phosphate synthase TrpC [Christensenellales bacterium]